jgi:uncharacterized protein (TIGR02453 family)
MFEKSFAFLNQVQQNNNRDWFQANRILYIEAKQEFESISELLIHEVSKFDKGIAGLLPKDCIYRVFRDVRFSSDKSPYKTNFGLFLSKGGRKSGYAGYYLHIEPGGSLLAGGLYMPPSLVIRAVRKDIFEHILEFKEIISNQTFIKYFNTLSSNMLIGAPKGFPKDFPDIELLKYKSYVVINMKSDNEMKNSNIVSEIKEVFKAMYSFNRFLNEAVNQAL